MIASAQHPALGHAHDHDHDPNHDHGHHDHAPARPALKNQHHHDHHGHDHHGHHHHGSANENRLRIALIITATFMLVEAVGGFVAGSLALVADAAHMLTDAASLLLALFAQRVARRPADLAYSYGRQRYEVLAAFVNGLALLAISTWIVIESARRLMQPQSVQSHTMLVIAVIGLLANLGSFLVLRDGSEDSINVRGAVLHVLSDMLGSAAAIVAALVIMGSGFTPIDPLLSALVAVLIVRGGWRITRQSAHILLEGAPADLQMPAVSADLVGSIAGVRDIHHMHIWSLTDERPIMTLHAVIDDGANQDAALAAIQTRLRDNFGVAHATVQIERANCGPASDCHDQSAAHG